MVNWDMKCKFVPKKQSQVCLHRCGWRLWKLDITNLDAIREKVRENDIQVIVNCAAYTNVDKAETDYDLANLLNNTAAGNLAQAMKEVDGTLIHVSTDYVFRATRIYLAVKIGKRILWGYMVKRNLQAKRVLKLLDASISSSAQHGSTRSGVRTSWRPCRVSRQATTPWRWSSTRWVLQLTLATWLLSSHISSKLTSWIRRASTTSLMRVSALGLISLRLSANWAEILAIYSLATARSSQAQWSVLTSLYLTRVSWSRLSDSRCHTGLTVWRSASQNWRQQNNY